MVEWMYWTPYTLTAASFLCLLILILAIFDVKKRSVPRKGFLPISTTRGDRIFISAVTSIGIGIIWLAIIGDMHLEILLTIFIIIGVVIVKFG